MWVLLAAILVVTAVNDDKNQLPDGTVVWADSGYSKAQKCTMAAGKCVWEFEIPDNARTGGTHVWKDGTDRRRATFVVWANVPVVAAKVEPIEHVRLWRKLRGVRR